MRKALVSLLIYAYFIFSQVQGEKSIAIRSLSKLSNKKNYGNSWKPAPLQATLSIPRSYAQFTMYVALTIVTLVALAMLLDFLVAMGKRELKIWEKQNAVKITRRTKRKRIRSEYGSPGHSPLDAYEGSDQVVNYPDSISERAYSICDLCSCLTFSTIPDWFLSVFTSIFLHLLHQINVSMDTRCQVYRCIDAYFERRLSMNYRHYHSYQYSWRTNKFNEIKKTLNINMARRVDDYYAIMSDILCYNYKIAINFNRATGGWNIEVSLLLTSIYVWARGNKRRRII